MVDDFNKVLDECIDRINRGENLDACLSSHPEYAEQLRSLLMSMVQAQTTCAFTPSENSERMGRQRLYAALERKRKPSFWGRLFERRSVWATVASVLIIGIFAYLGLRATVLSPGSPGENVANLPPASTALSTSSAAIEPTTEPGSDYIASANVNGNFAFLVSDEVNAISEFSTVNVTVSRVGVLQSGSSGRWQEFTPEVKEFDLSLLPGAKTLELWRGDVPEGEYTKAFIYVSQVTGSLKATGETVNIKLPSNKLQISLPFQVSAGNVTSVTYDLTVINTGNAQKAQKYLLKPQVGESGTSQKPLPKSGSGNDKTADTPADTLTPLHVTNNRKK